MSPLHLLGYFDNPHTGAERSMPELATAIAGRRPVRLWSACPVHPAFAQLSPHPIRHISAFSGAFPKGGMLVVSGIHVPLGNWLPYAKCERIVLRYNLPNNGQLYDRMAGIAELTGRQPELVFVSSMLQLSAGLPGIVQPSLITLDDYVAIERNPQPVFSVGRLSRDTPEKHHPDDPALYKMLAAYGMRVRIMGGTCLLPALAGVPGIELLPAGAMPAAEFYSGLDAMLYRTGAQTESYGRVVFEAMASALPVVAGAHGGYAQYIEQGQEGLLVRSQEQALEAVRMLAAKPELCKSLGAAARVKAIDLHGAQAMETLVQYYLG